MSTYIIEVICFQALFFGIYYVLLRKETFFTYNRIYLLVTPVLSLLLPFIKIAALEVVVPEQIVTVLPEVFIGQSLDQEVIALFNFSFSWFTFYFMGVIISMFILIVKFKKFASFLVYREKGKQIIELPASKEAFTFFNYIFIGSDIDLLSRKQILTHEKIHARQGHTWDLMLFELLRIVGWFNPLIYLYQNEISRVHEYLADQKATTGISKKAYYEELLNTAFGTCNLSFTNTFFNKSLIKNRIIMLQKSKSKKSALGKYVLIAPLVVGMLVYVSCSEDISLTEPSAANESLEGEVNKQSTNESQKYQAVEEFSKEEKYIEFDDAHGIPFGQITKVPMFPGCETKGTEEELRACFTDKISTHVNRRFDITVADKANLTGINRIFATFIVGKDGKVYNIRARAEHGLLEEEAKRVMASLPEMVAGEKDGEAVDVYYTLPITFKIAD